MEQLTIDITGSCPLACAFCYQELDGSRLSESDILNLVDGHSDATTVELGGGEPFVYKGFTALAEAIVERGRKVHVATSAIHIPAGFLELEDRIRAAITVQVSLHASQPPLYEVITGKDAFAVVLENTKQLASRYTTGLSAVIYQENLADVPHLVQLAEKLGLPLRCNLVMPVGKGKQVARLTAKQIDTLRGYLLGQRLAKGSPIDSPLIHPNTCTALAAYYNLPKQGSCPADCGAKCYASPRGGLSACEFLPEAGVAL